MNFEEMLKKARKRIDIVNKIRVGALMIAVVSAAILYFGNSYFKEYGWYTTIYPVAIRVTLVLIWVAALATVVKFPLIASHNKLVKRHKNGEI